jgi:hypothetical protein
VNCETGKRQQVRRHYGTEKQARDALAEITQQAATGTFVPRKAVTVEQLCEVWLALPQRGQDVGVSGHRGLTGIMQRATAISRCSGSLVQIWTSC